MPGSGCRDLLQATEVSTVRRLPVKARMRALGVVEAEVATDRGAGLGDRVVGSEIHLLILHRAPDPLDKNVVAPCTLAIHANGDAVPDEDAGEVGAGELAALIGVDEPEHGKGCGDPGKLITICDVSRFVLITKLAQENIYFGRNRRVGRSADRLVSTLYGGPLLSG